MTKADRDAWRRTISGCREIGTPTVCLLLSDALSLLNAADRIEGLEQVIIEMSAELGHVKREFKEVNAAWLRSQGQANI